MCFCHHSNDLCTAAVLCLIQEECFVFLSVMVPGDKNIRAGMPFGKEPFITEQEEETWKVAAPYRTLKRSVLKHIAEIHVKSHVCIAIFKHVCIEKQDGRKSGWCWLHNPTARLEAFPAVCVCLCMYLCICVCESVCLCMYVYLRVHVCGLCMSVCEKTWTGPVMGRSISSELWNSSHWGEVHGLGIVRAVLVREGQLWIFSQDGRSLHIIVTWLRFFHKLSPII